MKKILPFLFSFLFVSTAAAQEAPVDDVTGIVKGLIEAFKGGEWSVFASLCIMAAVWLITKAPGLSNLIKGKAKVWVAAVCGMLAAVAVTVFTTGDWVAAIGQGLTIGLSATGLFELVRRTIAGEAIDSNEDGILDPKE